MSKTSSKTTLGNFFEDFRVGQEFRHATPRTLTEADAALNVGLYGSRFAVNSSDEFARSIGLPRAPLDDLLVFHVVIGKTVNDISLNAVANLGYAEFRWGVPVYPGDTLSARSTVLGLRENSNKASGVVWVRSTGTNQKGEMVLDYVRWVMVHKRDPQAAVGAPVVPKTAPSVAPADLIVPAGLKLGSYDDGAAGSSHRWEDYFVVVDRGDGTTPLDALERLNVRPLRFETGALPEDAALMLASLSHASLVVGAGVHASLDDFLDRQRTGLASTYLTRLRLGPQLVDARAVPVLYSGRVRAWHLWLALLAGLLAVVAAIGVTPVGQQWFDDLRPALSDLFSTVQGLFS